MEQEPRQSRLAMTIERAPARGRMAAVQPEHLTEGESAMRFKWPAGHGNNAMPAFALPTQAGPDIEQITQQVIRRIDDKIIAHRERIGKRF